MNEWSTRQPAMTRAAFLRLATVTAAALILGGRSESSLAAPATAMQTRKIPASGEARPVVGLGTGAFVGASAMARVEVGSVSSEARTSFVSMEW